MEQTISQITNKNFNKNFIDENFIYQNLPSPVKKALILLGENHYYAGLVGGCVRDLLLHKTPQDWDICTNARPEQIQQVFSLYPQQTYGQKYGTITVFLENLPIEITTFRRETTYLAHRHPQQVIFTDDVFADLSRRDFTINSMFYHLQQGILDPYQGKADLQNQIIRALEPPNKKMAEDCLRILRGLRFAAQLSFTIEENTATAMQKNKDLLSLLSPERVANEMISLLRAANGPQILRQYADIFIPVFPELALFKATQQEKLWQQTITAMQQTDSFLFRLSFLCYAIEKASSSTKEKPFPYKATEELFAHRKFYTVKEFTKPLAQEILCYVRQFMQPAPQNQWEIYQMIKKLQNQPDRLKNWFLLQKIWYTSAPSAFTEEETKQYHQLLQGEQLFLQLLKNKVCFRIQDLQIDGAVLKNLGYPPNQQIKEELELLLEKVICHQTENTPKQLQKEAMLDLQQKKKSE